jgi:competence protein ComEA
MIFKSRIGTRRGLARGLVVLAVLAFSAPASSAAPGPEGVININQASAEQLALLPGIGATKAARIVVYRAKRPFKRSVDLARVKGIGLKTVRSLKAYLRVDGPSTLARPKTSASKTKS